VTGALSLFLVVYIGYLWQTVRGLNNNVQRIQVSLGGQTVNTRTGKTTTRYDIDGTGQNLLIFGNDDRSQLTDAQVRELKVGRDGGSLNTDTMMIVHVPADGSRATLISLPRDSYVNIPGGYGMDKLNAAYPDGYLNARGNRMAKVAAGASLLIETVQNLTGLNIDHFVEVSMLGFVTISDAIHGVQVNLCENVNDTVARNEADGLGRVGSGLVLSKGVHHIQGVQALEFVRQRHHLPGEDLGRTARQRYFLAAAFRTVASAGTLLNIGELRSLIAAVDKSIYVDQNLNMLDLAKQMSNLSANNISGEAIPNDGYETVTLHGYPSSVGIVNASQVKAFVRDMLDGSSSAYQKAKPVDPSTVSVDVRNFGSQNGAADTSATALKKAGFRTAVDQVSGRQTSTSISYPKGAESEAKTLARYVPGAQVQQAGVSTVTLTLGSDGVTAKSTPTVHHRHKHRAIDSSCIP
jgi:LCP family protein required for cell wall assembly